MLTDYMPENALSQFWMGSSNVKPQKLRILFSCAKEISVVNIRNSGKALVTKDRYKCTRF